MSKILHGKTFAKNDIKNFLPQTLYFCKKRFIILTKLSNSCENLKSVVFSFVNEISRIFVEL
jgi:hypothetical protein